MTKAVEYLATQATKFSIHNRDQINDNTKCGCYFCLRICSGSEITEWADKEKDTALCPHCGIDALMPNKTEALLLELAHEQFFTGDVSPMIESKKI